MLICVVEGRPLFFSSNVQSPMLSDAALESSQHEKKKTVNRGDVLSFLTKKIVVRTKNALTSVRAERFASTEYQGKHFGQKKLVCSSPVSKYRLREGTPTQWSFIYDTPDPSRMCLYVCEEMRKRDRL